MTISRSSIAGTVTLALVLSCSSEMRPTAPVLRTNSSGPVANDQDSTRPASDSDSGTSDTKDPGAPPSETPTKPVIPPAMAGATPPSGSLVVTFAPVVPPNSGYPNVFIYAMWITDSAGKYVKTFAAATQNTNRLRYLDKWITASGVALPTQPDGITGPTLTYAASPMVTGTWNLKDKAGVTVPAGTYMINIQLASSNAPGPSLQVPITIGSTGEMKTDSTQTTGITKVTAKHTP